MSEPKRYEFIYNENYASVEREEHKEGDYVSYEDYARLKTQVERLIEAGDELERVLTSRISSYEVGNASHEWRSAKGVKS